MGDNTISNKIDEVLTLLEEKIKTFDPNNGGDEEYLINKWQEVEKMVKESYNDCFDVEKLEFKKKWK